MTLEKLENDYIKQYPNEENPFNWFIQFELEDIIAFVKARKGRKVLVKENPKVTDGGTLIYE